MRLASKPVIIVGAVLLASLVTSGVLAAAHFGSAHPAKPVQPTTSASPSQQPMPAVASSSPAAATPSVSTPAPTATPKSSYFQTFHEYEDIPVLFSTFGSFDTPTCTTITFSATFHAVEPATVTYRWQTPDGQTSGPLQLVFAAAGDRTVTWTANHPSTKYLNGSVTIVETSPNSRTVTLPYQWQLPPACYEPQPTPPPTPPVGGP